MAENDDRGDRGDQAQDDHPDGQAEDQNGRPPGTARGEHANRHEHGDGKGGDDHPSGTMLRQVPLGGCHFVTGSTGTVLLVLVDTSRSAAGNVVTSAVAVLAVEPADELEHAAPLAGDAFVDRALVVPGKEHAAVNARRNLVTDTDRRGADVAGLKADSDRLFAEHDELGRTLLWFEHGPDELAVIRGGAVPGTPTAAMPGAVRP